MDAELQPTQTIHEYVLGGVRINHAEPPFPLWYIRLTPSEYGYHWINFDIYHVCYTNGYPDSPSQTLMFLPEGWSASVEDAQPFSEKSEKTLHGYIKWDGCTEFEVNREHFCNAADSYSEFHACIQFTLSKAHSFMNAEWRPLRTLPELLTSLRLVEIPRSRFT